MALALLNAGSLGEAGEEAKAALDMAQRYGFDQPTGQLVVPDVRNEAVSPPEQDVLAVVADDDSHRRRRHDHSVMLEVLSGRELDLRQAELAQAVLSSGDRATTTDHAVQPMTGAGYVQWRATRCAVPRGTAISPGLAGDAADSVRRLTQELSRSGVWLLMGLALVSCLASRTAALRTFEVTSSSAAARSRPELRTKVA